MTLRTFTYLIRPTRSDMLSEGHTPEEEEIVSRHADYLAGLAEKQVIIFIGRALTTDASAFGIIVMQTDTIQEAQEIMENDPAVREGVMTSTLLPFKVVHMNPAQSEWFEFS